MAVGAYEQVNERLDDLRSEMRALRNEMSALRADMDVRFEAQRGEVNGKLNTMTIVIGTVGAAGVAALGGIAASLVMLALRI